MWSYTLQFVFLWVLQDREREEKVQKTDFAKTGECRMINGPICFFTWQDEFIHQWHSELPEQMQDSIN